MTEQRKTGQRKTGQRKTEGRKQVQFFTAVDAVPLGPETMPAQGENLEAAAAMARKLAEQGHLGVGERATVLFSEAGGDGMSLVHGWFKSGYALPPHSHSADCLYYVLAGQLQIGARVLSQGEGMFIPSGHAYAYEAGPAGVEVLEFRNVGRFNIDLSASGQVHWERMASLYGERAAIWRTESPPSARHDEAE